MGKGFIDFGNAEYRVQPVEGIRGVWPEKNATRINKSDYISGVGSKVIYTVPAGCKLFVSTAGLSSVQTAVETGGGYMEARNAADVHQYYFLNHSYCQIDQMNTFVNFCPAVELEAGWKVLVAGNIPGIIARGLIWGWLESA